MKTISDRIKEERIKEELEASIIEVYEEELEDESVDVFEEATMDEDLDEDEPLESKVILEDPEEIVDDEIILEEKTKDELNDYAVRLGYSDEIKGYWSKSKILKTLKKLLGA